VDDHPVFRRGLRMIIDELEDVVVQGFEDGDDFMSSNESFDVVLLDVCMPGSGGLAVLQTQNAGNFQCRPILLGTNPKPCEVRQAVALGALGVLRKDADPEEIHDAIRHVERGETYFPAFVARMLIDQARRKLTDREIEVLALLVDGAQNKEIAGQLDISVYTVRDVVRRVYRKLDVQTRVEAVRVAADEGLLTLQGV